MLCPFTKDSDLYSRDDILAKLPGDVQCWYAPRNVFVEELMSKVSKTLRTNSKITAYPEYLRRKKNRMKHRAFFPVQAADSEISLVHSRYIRNDTSKVLWVIFEVDKHASGKPEALKYKIRSSEIGESRMIMMHEEEPVREGTLNERVKIA